MVSQVSKWLSQLPVFFKKASLSFSMRFGGLALQLLGSIIIARLLGAEEFGAFTYAATWAMFLGLLLPLGFGELSIRELPKYLMQQQLGMLSGFLMATASMVLLMGGVASVALWILESRDILTLAPGWKLVAIYATIHGLILSVSSALNGFQRILTSQFLETILRQIIYLSLIAFVMLVGLELTAHTIFSLMLYAALPVLFIMLLVLRNMHESAGARQIRAQYQPKIWVVGALPLFVTALANQLQLDMGVLMVGGMLGGAETGVFRVAARGAVLVTIANMIAIQLVGPMLSRAIAANNAGDTQKLLTQAATVSFVTGIPICLILGFGAHYYLGMFGSEFTGGVFTLQLLLLGQATIVFAGADAILLVMLNKERLVFILTSAGALLNFVLNLILIKKMGIEGAAIAALVSITFIRFGMVAFVRRTTGYDTTLIRPLKAYFTNGR